ncbi:glycosyltransferase family 2 protein [Sphingomonas lutea]|uniref:Glycosyltransferase family 2 protein n=1 Tax=Sphingomonas lutea TaxID=1045317 RepID=A0A7G9SLC1_9SPHN|nr:glycosyltransferase family 2 protein [Sphingomonas lutea]
MSAPADQIRIAVVTVNYRTSDLAIRCLEALAPERALLPKLKALVVDGGSADGSADRLTAFVAERVWTSWVTVVPLELNGGFGWANNQAILRLLKDEEPPDFIHLLNPDAEIEVGAVKALLDDLLAHPLAGASGSQLLSDTGELEGSAFTFPTLLGEFSRGAQTGIIDRLLSIPPVALPPASDSVDADWVTGASVMFRTEALRQVGLFDDGFFLYHEEVELMWRLRRAGWMIRHVPRSRVRHIGGAATGLQNAATSGSSRPRRPAYWYESRRRFFSLTRGRAAAAAAACLWLMGYVAWTVRRVFGLTRGGSVKRELWDELRLVIPWRRDVPSESTRWDEPRSEIPAWMSRK